MSRNVSTNRLLQEAYNKYGAENFKFEILEECKKEEIGEREKYYIQKYDTYEHGYNANTGGNSGFKVKDSSRELISKHHADVSGDKNPAYNIPIKERIKNYDSWHEHIAEANRRNMTANKYYMLVTHRTYKPCTLYDVFGRKIKEFKSQKDCLDYLDINLTTIVGRWIKYKYFVADERHPFKYNHFVIPSVFNNIVFQNIDDVSKYIGLSKSMVKQYLNNKRPIPEKYNGLHRYSIEKDLPKLESGEYSIYNGIDICEKFKGAIKRNHALKRVSQFTLDGVFIKTYDSIKEASQETGIYDSGIIRCCKGQNKMSGGFVWRYA